MATWVHREVDGETESILVEASVLDGHIASGWSIEDPDAEVTEADPEEEADDNES